MFSFYTRCGFVTKCLHFENHVYGKVIFFIVYNDLYDTHNKLNSF